MQNKSKKTVLVVDDEELIRELLYDILESDYEVLLAEDGEKGLELYMKQNEEIDAVITDLIMPKMRGDKLLEKLRALNPQIPVIIITGFEKEIDLVRILKEPKVAFINKPFDIEQLLNELSILVETGAS